MSSYDMAAELVDALEAGVNKVERLEETLRERDATIAHLRACEVAFDKPFCGGGDGDENGNPYVTHTLTAATFMPFVERTMVPLLERGVGERIVVVTVPGAGAGMMSVYFPVVPWEGTEIRGVFGDLGGKGDGK